jgi:hypothetical protein
MRLTYSFNFIYKVPNTLLMATNLLCLTVQQVSTIADAVYRVEGGVHTKHPYGIMCQISNPRHTCCVTINHAFKDWRRLGDTNNFIDFLANRYCPMQCDPVGNRNWKHNMHSILERSQSKSHAKPPRQPEIKANNRLAAMAQGR